MAGEYGDPAPDASFTAWTRRQSYARFLLKVSGIAWVQLLLTAFWLRLLFRLGVGG